MAGGACGGSFMSGASCVSGRSVAGCSRACCAFCSCRCHREGWQQSGRFFMRTVIPCPLGFQRKDWLATQGQAPSQGPPPLRSPFSLPASRPSKAPERSTANLMTEQPPPGVQLGSVSVPAVCSINPILSAFVRLEKEEINLRLPVTEVTQPPV